MSEDSSLSEEQRRMLAGTGPRRLGCWITIVVVVVILAVAAWIFRAVYLPAASANAGGPPGSSGGGGGGGGGKRNRGGGTAQPVVMAPATRRDVDITLDALGSVTPLATVTVRTQIAGNLTQIAFTEGQTVKAGDFLAEVDPRPYQLALDQYQGQVQRDQALLTQSKADLARYQTLAQQDSIAQQQVDASTALVGQYQGDLVVDQAQIGTAKLNLAYCHIVAPVSGRVGMRQVDAGNYVTPGDSAGIVVITQTQPMSVIFNLPEDNLPAVLKRTHAGATLSVTAFDRSGATRLADGSLVAIDNQIDPTTGTVRLRANFANADEGLFAGQFVNARLLVDTLPHAVVVPSSAVLHGTPGAYVYVVTDAPATAAAATPDATASAPAPVAGDAPATSPAVAGGSGTASVVAVRVVTLGPVAGDDVTILTGLAPGERVVVDGADKLKDGLAVTATMLGASGHGGHRRRNGDGSATAASAATEAAPAGDAEAGSWHRGDGQGWPPPDGASATAPDDGTHPHHHRHHGATAADGSAGAPDGGAGAPAADDAGGGAWHPTDGQGWPPPDGSSATSADDGTQPRHHRHHGATAADGSAGATSADAGAGMSSP